VFGARRALEKALDVVSAQNADLKQQIRDLELEKRELLDRIMSLTYPGALREVRRPPQPRDEATPADPDPDEERVYRFPGSDLLVEPSRPATPPVPRFAPSDDEKAG